MRLVLLVLLPLLHATSFRCQERQVLGFPLSLPGATCRERRGRWGGGGLSGYVDDPKPSSLSDRWAKTGPTWGHRWGERAGALEVPSMVQALQVPNPNMSAMILVPFLSQAIPGRWGPCGPGEPRNSCIMNQQPME